MSEEMTDQVKNHLRRVALHQIKIDLAGRGTAIPEPERDAIFDAMRSDIEGMVDDKSEVRSPREL
jgi:hypothetical protein